MECWAVDKVKYAVCTAKAQVGQSALGTYMKFTGPYSEVHRALQ
jgi:hypothetical protein